MPVYETLPGWQCDTTGVTSSQQLPDRAKSYLNRLGQLCGVPVAFIGVGPERKQTLVVP